MNQQIAFENKVEALLSDRGISGGAYRPGLRSLGDLSVSFVRSDGVQCGVTAGGRITEHRTLDDLAKAAAERIADWYAAYDRGDFSPKQPQPIGIVDRIVGSLYIVLKAFQHTGWMLGKFWRKDIRQGDKFELKRSITMEFNTRRSP